MPKFKVVGPMAKAASWCDGDYLETEIQLRWGDTQTDGLTDREALGNIRG